MSEGEIGGTEEKLQGERKRERESPGRMRATEWRKGRISLGGRKDIRRRKLYLQNPSFISSVIFLHES